MTTETNALNDVQASFVAQGVQLLNAQIEQANRLAEAGQRAEQSGKLVFEIRDSTDTQDDVIKKYQQWRERALKELAKREADIEAHIRTNYEQFNGEASEAYDPEKTAIEYKALTDTIKGTQKALESLNKGQPLTGITELKNLPGSRKSSGSGGSGVKRPRFESVQVRKAGSEQWVLAEMDKRDPQDSSKVIGKTSNLSAAAAYITKETGKKLSAGELGTACIDQAKKDFNTEDLSSLGGKEIVFVVSVGDANYEIQAIPQTN